MLFLQYIKRDYTKNDRFKIETVVKLKYDLQ